MVDNLIRLPLDGIRLRESVGFQEPLGFIHPPENLSARWRNAQFGYINKIESNNTLPLFLISVMKNRDIPIWQKLKG
jgi:hypothetical protein